MRAMLGLAGWAYPEWVGPFYARGTPPSGFLAAYARAFGFVEMDGTYYAAPSREDVARWTDATPSGFVFSPKLPKSVVAAPRIEETQDEVADFLARLAPMRAAGKLGPVLAVFPPGFRRGKHAEALARFLADWPRDVRLAVELRHGSWWEDATFELLRAHGAIHVWAVTQYGRTPPVLTTSDVYLRLVGDRALDDVTDRWDRVRRDQTPEVLHWRAELERLSDRIETLWVIANNHFTGYAPETMRRVAEALQLHAPDLAAAARDPRQRGLSLG